MFVLDTPLNLEELLQQQDGVLNGLKRSRNEIANVYLKRIATLNELSANQRGRVDNQQEFSLTFATATGDELGRLKRTVLFAPLGIGGDIVPPTILCESNIVLMVENPRLEFIKLANLVLTYLKDFRLSDDDLSRSVIYGENCIIKSGAIIGNAGFGFERDVDGTPIRFPHFGRVLLGDDVEIGANTVISKGAIEDTLVGDSTKIDDLVYVAHNCKIGKKVMIAGNATLCGGVQIGDGAWIGAGASIKQNIKIGEGAIVGMGAVVTRDVPAYSTVVGNPARVIRQNEKTQGAV